MREKPPLGFENGGAPSGAVNGWQEVVRKKKKQSMEERGVVDIASSVWKVPYKDTFSFFFSEFPETHGAKEMLKAFMLYGEAMEVVIPPKRDKRGRRFGFVRFRNVEDPRVFAVKLDNIIFGANKIHVNVPRFQREWIDNPKPQNVPRQWENKQAPLPHDTHHQNHALHREEPRVDHHRRVMQVWKKKEGNAEGGRKFERQDPKNQGSTNQQNNDQQAPKIISHRKNIVSEVYYDVPEGIWTNSRRCM